MPVTPLEFSLFEINGFLEMQLCANSNAKTQRSTSNFIHQVITMTACLLKKVVKDDGDLFLKLARLVPNPHALPRSKSTLHTWGWTVKVMQRYCTISRKRAGPRACLAWQHWALSSITSSSLLFLVCPGLSFLGQILSSTARLIIVYCNRALHQLEGITQNPVLRVQRHQRQWLAASISSSARASLFLFIFQGK